MSLNELLDPVSGPPDSKPAEEREEMIAMARATVEALATPKPESTTVRNRRRRELLRAAWLACEPARDDARQTLPTLVACCILNVTSGRYDGLREELLERLTAMTDLVRRAR